MDSFIFSAISILQHLSYTTPPSPDLHRALTDHLLIISIIPPMENKWTIISLYARKNPTHSRGCIH